MEDRWRYIAEENVSSSYGLATDEYLMKNVSKGNNGFGGNLRLYNYADYSALCGRFQNIHAEINIQRCKELNYGFGRRLTGGGAIIMGQSQLGICLTLPAHSIPGDNTREIYQHFAQPIIKALNTLGIHAGFKSKNDLEVNGKKIAGLGLHIDVSGGVQFHASLLLDLDVLQMLEVLNIPIQKYDDRKKIWAVNQRLTTICKETGSLFSMDEIKLLLKNAFADFLNVQFEHISISAVERNEIRALENSRYNHADWIFQHSPQEDMTGMSLHKTPAGLLRTYIGLKGKTIKSVLITGDYLEHEELLRQIEAALKWSPLEADRIRGTIQDVYRKYTQENILLPQEDIAHAILLAARKAKTALDYHYNGSCYYPKSIAR